MLRVVKMAGIALIAITLLCASAGAFEVGPLDVGGAVRVNYINGDYVENDSDAPQRGGEGGIVVLDTYRINLEYEQGPFIGSAEYRWYQNYGVDGYNFLHHGWVGYKFEDDSQVEVGLNRVPFGVGAYGPANSWFFDQHYYVGLADDMDYGVKYSKSMENVSVDLAYYASEENSFMGASDESARYSYDIVDNGSKYSYYTERNQANVRMIFATLEESFPTDVGFSLQAGQLKADETYADDSEAYAAAVHSKTSVGPWGLMLQCSQYKYDADYKDPSLSDDLIVMGAYDFAWPVATEGTIPAVALSYTWECEKPWADSITFYNDYSIIMKDGGMVDGTDFNDSAMNVTGMAIANGGWYIYVDYAYSDGNYFVGNEGDVYGDTYADSEVGDFGANQNDDWKGRFNINFGYYF